MAVRDFRWPSVTVHGRRWPSMAVDGRLNMWQVLAKKKKKRVIELPTTSRFFGEAMEQAVCAIHHNNLQRPGIVLLHWPSVAVRGRPWLTMAVRSRRWPSVTVRMAVRGRLAV